MTIGNSTPLISCICVTKNRYSYLQKTIQCFKKQTYPNKELVVIYESFDVLTSKMLLSLNEINVIQLKVDSSKRIPLGDLRNLGIERSKGDYICQWDDDDWYHSNRLQAQFNLITNSGLKGSILNRWIIHNSLTHKSYLSDFGLKEGTIMCERGIMMENPYASKVIDEDSEVIYRLFDDGLLAVSDILYMLYIYVVHGFNTWNADHFDYMISLATPFSDDASKQIHHIISTKLFDDSASKTIDQIVKESE